MFETLLEQPTDKILALMAAYRSDTREGKIDLGVGIYKNAKGQTPVMRSVKAAEKRIWEQQDTKKYTSLAGEPEYNDAMIELLMGADAPRDQLASIATPGGTGAIHQAVELIRASNPDAVIWLSAPTWPNHPSIIEHCGMKHAEYRYFDPQTGDIDEEGMLADLTAVKPGDAVLIHGCCHNPTGANPTSAQVDKIIEAVKSAGAMPLVDIAYQGFGDGLEEDAAATRKILAAFDEVLVAASCSKNFGIYRERTGILIGKTSADRVKILQGMLNFLNRQNFSFPPDHGARIVSTILSDAELRSDWKSELEEIRGNMLTLRNELADQLRQQTNSDRFDFVARHRGMFSLLGLTPEQVENLRERHSIYMVGDSRINIAGLNSKSIPTLAKAIASVL